MSPGHPVTPSPRPDAGRHRLLAGRLSLDQLMDVRRQIEPRLAELAATRAGAGDLAQLEILMRQSREAVQPQEYDLADEGFHYRIAELAGNALFLEVYDLIRQMRREAGRGGGLHEGLRRARRAPREPPGTEYPSARVGRMFFDRKKKSATGEE